MKLKKLVYILFCTVFISPAHADLYLELGLESGGDYLIGTDTGQEISAGGGVKIAAGVQNPVNDIGTASIRLSLAYLFDSIDAYNGEADIDTLSFDALYMIHSGPHSLGVGGTLHMSPEYRDSVNGFRPLRIEYDDAVGALLQYGYHPVPGLEIGVRLSNIDYENGTQRIDASSFGLFISNGF